MITKIKEIACEFTDDVEKAHYHPVTTSLVVTCTAVVT